eukprot:COSAG01_NODE_3299_length_6296_cov_243.565112_2_plen_156_part_00
MPHRVVTRVTALSGGGGGCRGRVLIYACILPGETSRCSYMYTTTAVTPCTHGAEAPSTLQASGGAPPPLAGAKKSLGDPGGPSKSESCVDRERAGPRKGARSQDRPDGFSAETAGVGAGVGAVVCRTEKCGARSRASLEASRLEIHTDVELLLSD